MLLAPLFSVVFLTGARLGDCRAPSVLAAGRAALEGAELGAGCGVAPRGAVPLASALGAGAAGTAAVAVLGASGAIRGAPTSGPVLAAARELPAVVEKRATLTPSASATPANATKYGALEERSFCGLSTECARACAVTISGASSGAGCEIEIARSDDTLWPGEACSARRVPVSMSRLSAAS